MKYCDYHIHSTFSDGKHTPEEIILTAIEKGMTEIGFSDHSYTFFDERYCINKDNIKNYQTTIRNLALKYKDKIKVLCGIEQDFYSNEPTNDYDYSIGSVHYFKLKNDYIPVDESAQTLLNTAQKYFNGDMLCLVEEYFKTVSKVVEKTNCDIIGHFDLITKFNENNALFDENSSRYQTAAFNAVEALLKYNRPFEINTGAISRGYRTTPYPSQQILDFIIKNGGKTVLSSDSHQKDTICYNFDTL